MLLCGCREQTQGVLITVFTVTVIPVTVFLPRDPGDLNDRLLLAIQAGTGIAGLGWAVPPTPLAGGFWATMFVVELSGAPEALRGRKVARLMPDATTAAHETAVQRWAYAAGVPVPVIHAAGPPSGSLDAWNLMDFAPGQPLLLGLSAIGALRNVRAIARQMPDVLAQAAARLHQCDTRSLASSLSTTGRDPSITAFLRRLGETAAAFGRDDLADHAHRLEAASPNGAVLCHGDIHPFNVLVDGDDWTLIDWSTAVIADPHYDLAFTTLMLANPPLGGPRPIRAVARAIGNRLARRFLRRYEHHASSSVDPARLDWGRSVHALRALVEIAEWEAAGTTSAHAGHPWLQLRPTLELQLQLVRS